MHAEVGDFRQGSPVSRWALARYLVGRAIAQSVSRALLLVALACVALAAVAGWFGSTFAAVFLALVALAVFATRGLLRAVLRRLTAADQIEPIEARLRALVAATRADVLAELRRIGLPGHTWSLPLLALRLARPSRRGETIARLRSFELDRVVPQSRVDELHLVLRVRDVPDWQG